MEQIKVKNIRIGNVVKKCYNSYKASVESDISIITDDDLKIMLSKRNDVVYLPVTITEDYLKRLGFKKVSEDSYDGFDWIYHFTINDFEISVGLISETKDLDIFLFSGDSIKHIKYINELQNLFFALTNYELKFKYKL